ncbi:MAG: outer membrane beta-barrel protein [Pseudomonadota bacterium]
MSLPRFAAPLCVVAVLAICTPSPALAAPFVSGSLARTSTKFDDVKDGTGFSLAAGYEVDRFGAFPLFFEGSYYDSGKLKVDDSGGLRLSYDGFQAFGGIALKLGNDDGSRVWAKVGYYSLDGKISDGSDSASEKTTGLSFGFGGDWMFSKQIGARFELEQPTKVKAFPGLSIDGTSALSIVKIGLVWRPQFGGSATTAPVARERGDVYLAPAPKLVAPFGTSGSATVRAGTGIRAQPKADSRLVGSASADTVVTLDGSSSGVAGEWWFVKGTGIAGWVPASELAAP